jgi:glycerol uptake facilitator-like aquaporin
MSEYRLSQKLIAELIGTTLLVTTVVGSGIMASHLTSDVGLQLLGNTIPTAAILYVLINIFGPISGAHFNPVVSLVLALNRLLPFNNVVAYSIVQVIGGILGTVVAHIMFDMTLIEMSTQVRTGNAMWFSEFIATFGLVMTIVLGVRHSQSNLPGLVAFYITSAYWFTASTSFANPAVTIARSLTNSFSGIAPSSCIGFILAQLIGALAASFLTGSLFNVNVKS